MVKFHRLMLISQLSILCTILHVSNLQAQSEHMVWQTDFHQAMQQAKGENKYVLLNFSGSDWCANCIRLDNEVFNTPDFIAYADSYFVAYRADFPVRKKNAMSIDMIKQNEQLAEQYNREGVFPLVLVLNAEGHPV